MGRPLWYRYTVTLAAVCTACTFRPHSTAPAGDLFTAESVYADLRGIRDRIEIAEAGDIRPGATPVSALIPSHNALRQQLALSLRAVDSAALAPEDARALGIMRRALASDLDSLAQPAPLESELAKRPPDCRYDARALAARPNGVDSLRKRIYVCYASAQSRVVVGSDTMDRLSVLGSIGRTENRDRRRRLFLALTPVWRSINGDNDSASPYRRLIAGESRSAARGTDPSLQQALAAGIPPDSLEPWLLRVLDTWRSVAPDSLTEPWDWFYQTGTASRRLSRLLPRSRLAALNHRVYQSLGADVEELGVRFDLEPREGKTPVAFCTFGSRPRFINGAWRPAEPWVFATYRTGGLDNLNELLHESGHAVHIAAIRTRPAFADWPDSDPFIEAVAEFAALDVYEPAWQQHWLGDSVPLLDGLRSRYGAIVLDVAWALFEVRMRRTPGADPNLIWAGLTQDYLRIRAHPELSWWAMRGQLVEAPGYMMNYAAGSILAAALRERTRKLHGPFATGDSTWYAWISPRLFRFGLERPAKDLIREFLGAPVSPDALLQDIRRMAR